MGGAMPDRDNQQPSYSAAELVLGAIANWVNKFRNTIGLNNEFGQCGPDEVMQAAKDLGVTPNQLRELVSKGPGAADLLQKMLVALHVDPEALADTDPLIMRELQRLCITCGDKKRCEHEFANGTAANHFREFCPNALTLETLISQKDQSSRQVAPVTMKPSVRIELETPGILIVDDNEDNRYMLQLLLEEDGHKRIASVADGSEAIAFLEKQKFNLVLLDMMMPDLNGDEVLKIIKGNPDTRDIPVVMISADTDIEKVSKCIELGADDYLPKPFNPVILRARIGAALRRGSLRGLENNYLAKLEQEKRNSENLLRNILPPEIAIRLRNGETNIADRFDDATVIFADIVGFGKITARMKAYEIVGCLNHLFSEFDRLAEDVGVEKIKTIGDSYMAVAGIPTPRASHGRTATKLALDMIAAVQRLQSSLPATFSIRVGLHSGPVMAGVIGSRKFAYDVWGDTVNIASRLEQASHPNRVLVSDATAKLLGEDFQVDGPHKIGTKEQRVLEAFFVSRR
jgi:adenylate cyclase